MTPHTLRRQWLGKAMIDVKHHPFGKCCINSRYGICMVSSREFFHIHKEKMMQSFSNVVLGGHVGDKPFIGGEEGKLFASLSLAINRKWRKDETLHEATDWMHISVPTSLVSIVQNYVNKGDPLVVEGELRTRQWAKGDEKHTNTYVLARKIRLVKPHAEKTVAESTDTDSFNKAKTEALKIV
jgi:single-strand DNA-binding protein